MRPARQWPRSLSTLQYFSITPDFYFFTQTLQLKGVGRRVAIPQVFFSDKVREMMGDSYLHNTLDLDSQLHRAPLLNGLVGGRLRERVGFAYNASDLVEGTVKLTGGVGTTRFIDVTRVEERRRKDASVNCARWPG